MFKQETSSMGEVVAQSRLLWRGLCFYGVTSQIAYPHFSQKRVWLKWGGGYAARGANQGLARSVVGPENLMFLENLGDFWERSSGFVLLGRPGPRR